jgi:hypothetical protein
MVIDQRNAGASVTQNTSGQYSVDRWNLFGSVTSKFTIQQNAGSVTPPAGFVNYLGITSSSAYTVGASELFIFGQKVEGFNIADLGWGTANAKTVTLSFWVRSSLTGTFGGSFRNSNGSRSYPFTYTINAANTWEYETITIAGDTSGTWQATNSTGIDISFNLGTGSTFSGTAGSWSGGNFVSATGATSVVGTNGATFYITGVQLEVGTQATSFEYRQYGTEFALCCRYFQKLVEPSLSGYAPTGTAVWRMGGILPVQMRAAGTITLTGNPPIQSAGATSLTAVTSNYAYNGNSIEFDGTLNASVSVNASIIKTICTASTTAINISAEL